MGFAVARAVVKFATKEESDLSKSQEFLDHAIERPELYCIPENPLL
jgi:hypothetical protein